MGSSVATDAIVRTPIYEGDVVFMICLYEHKYKFIFEKEPRLINMRHLTDVFELLRTVSPARSKPEDVDMSGILLAIGQYNGYKWLKNLEGHEARHMNGADQKFTCFIHREVLEWLGIDTNKGRDLREILVDILYFAFSARIELFDQSVFGQDSSDESKKYHKRLLEVMKKANEAHF